MIPANFDYHRPASVDEAVGLLDRYGGDGAILAETVNVIADPQVRNMGTLGGDVANGDPGNDMPAVLMALDAVYVLENVQSIRSGRIAESHQGRPR